jgi:hypothetical protein
MTDTMLSQAQAEELVLARLNSRFEPAQFSIADNGIAERSFGWVFLIHAVQPASGDALEAKLPRAVIVNKYSEQIIASSIDHEPERLIQLYETLLAKNRARADNWCLTVEIPWPWDRWRKRTIAERAKEAGFYEITAKEKGL